MFTKSRLVVLLVACLVLVSGCRKKGNPNAPAKVSGKVLYKGQPVTGGTLTFYAKDAGAYMTPIAPDGSFNSPDLPAGELTVTVDTSALDPKVVAQREKGMKTYGGPGREMKMSTPQGAPTETQGTFVPLPPQYSDKMKSPVKITLQPGAQKKDITLE